MNSRENQNLPSERPEESGEIEYFPVRFVGDSVGPLFVAGLIVPIVFMFIARSKLALMPVGAADIAVQFLGMGWHGLRATYDSFKDAGRLHEATTLASCFVIELVFFAYVFRSVLRKYFQRRDEIHAPDVVIDGMIILMGIVGYFTLSKMDITTNQASFQGLYLDTYGFYYIKQYLLFWCIIGLPPLVLLISILKKFDRRKL